MHSQCLLTVSGGNIHIIPMHRLLALQAIVAELGAASFPLFLRLASTQLLRLQPVTARTLLAEVEAFMPRLKEVEASGMAFLSATGNELGRIYARAEGEPILREGDSSVGITPDGIRMVLTELPPPVGFRTAAGMPRGHFECYFERLERTSGGWQGVRTQTMGGSGAPVSLPAITLPPVTRWDSSWVSGAPVVNTANFFKAPSSEVFQDELHALETACNDSLRLKHPLHIRRE
jgi:hypothetical protein